MPITVVIPPNVTQSQGQVIQDATINSYGVMTPAQVVLLNSLASRAGGSAEFLFRPGGPEQLGVFAAWSDLMAAVNSVTVPVTIFFDSSFAPCVVPAGTWDMKNVTWQAVWGARQVVTVQEGSIFTNFRNIGTDLNILFSGTTPPVSDFGQGGPQIIDADLFYIGLRSSITTNGKGPFFTITVPNHPCILALDSAQIFTGTVPAIFLNGKNTQFSVALLPAGQLQDNTLSGTAGSVFAYIEVGSGTVISQNQPAFLGTSEFLNLTAARVNPSAKVIAPASFNANPNDLVLCDTTNGSLKIFFKPPANMCIGLSISIANQSDDAASSITAIPQPGDTINGQPNFTLNGPRASAEFRSDGISDWVVFFNGKLVNTLTSTTSTLVNTSLKTSK